MIKDRSSYLFLVGKVRFLETQLFRESDLTRFLENSSEEALINDLQNTKYGKLLSDYDFNMALDTYIYQSWLEFKKKVEDSRILDLFMLKRDVLNFINYKKGIDAEKYYAGGVFKLNRDEENPYLPPIFKETEERLAKYSVDKSETIPDNLVEKVFMDIVTENYINPLETGLIKNYWQDMVDINNLLKNVNYKKPEYYWAGGKIESSFWEKVRVSEEIPSKISSKKYMKAVGQQSKPTEWELKLHQYLLKYIKSMKKITFGPEAVVAFMLSLFTEVKNLNMIRAGINLGLEKKEIKANLILGYV